MPPDLTRRSFLGSAAASSVVAARVPAPRLGVPRQGWAGEPDLGRFTHGVASGDPDERSVVLWTRALPGPDNEPTALRVEVAGDEQGLEPVTTRRAGVARAEQGHCLSVLVDGLEPGTTYWYRFVADDGAASVIGRTRTAPDGPASDVRFGVVSCARLPSGTYSAYHALAAEDVDAVVHLGDYIYEDGNDGHEPPRVLATVDDYRERYAQYRREPALQELHRMHPFISVWDDHEFSNNVSSDSLDAELRSIAVQAWREWIPARQPNPDDPAQIWRRLRYGELVDLFCIDTRAWGRDRQATTLADARSADRTILGADQRSWLTDGLSTSSAAWAVVANQVMFAPLFFPVVTDSVRDLLERSGVIVEGDETANPDQWDGYVADRNRVIAAADRGTASAVFVTGDIHSSWASVVPGDDGRRAVLEFVGPSVSSSTFGDRIGDLAVAAEGVLLGANDTLRHVDLTGRGFMTVVFTPDQVTTAYRYVDATKPQGRARFDAVLRAPRGHGEIDTLEEAEFPPRPALPPGPAAADRQPNPVNTRSGPGSRSDSLVWLAPAAAVAGVAGAIGLRRRRAR